MTTLRSLSLATLLAVTLTACAQNPTGPVGPEHAAHHPPGAPAPATAPADRMAMMDAHMARMRDMHEKMVRATTPQERQALMAEHMKLMHDGMAMMGGMGRGGTGMGMCATGPGGAASGPMGMAACQQMMEKRMDMMQSMMQMMMDRMGPPAPGR